MRFGLSQEHRRIGFFETIAPYYPSNLSQPISNHPCVPLKNLIFELILV